MAAREIFVFGSNLAGRHGAGAALWARKHYGARPGVGEGLTGDAYALPTKDGALKPLLAEAVAESVRRFCRFAEANRGWRFLVTPVGTGLAGFSREFIWAQLQRSRMPPNCLLTASWLEERLPVGGCAIDPGDPDACGCVKVRQDKTCPVGWPSLLCDECGGVGLTPLAQRLDRKGK